MGWLIALGVLIALAVMPIGLRARYDTGGPLVWMYVGPVKIPLYPTAEKEKKKKKKPSKETSTKEMEKKEIKKDSIEGFLEILKTVLDFIKEFRSKLLVRRLDMKLVLASEDPSALAMNYGRAWALLGNLMPLLERHFRIKKRNLEVECDFTATETVIYVYADLMLPLFRALWIALRHGLRAVKQYLKLDKTRKGGAINEPKST